MCEKIIRKPVLVFLLGLFILIPRQDVFGQRRERGRGDEMRTGRREHVIKNLPRERTRIVVGGREYFYSAGVFYRTGPQGYITVGAPFGARIGILPPGYRAVRFGRAPFFVYLGTYYRYDPAARVYVVVPPPTGTPEEPQTLDTINLAGGQTILGTYMGGSPDTVQVQVGQDLRLYPVNNILSIDFAPPSSQ